MREVKEWWRCFVKVGKDGLFAYAVMPIPFLVIGLLCGDNAMNGMTMTGIILAAFIYPMWWAIATILYGQEKDLS